jgi:hypothetical protein
MPPLSAAAPFLSTPGVGIDYIQKGLAGEGISYKNIFNTFPGIYAIVGKS